MGLGVHIMCVGFRGMSMSVGYRGMSMCRVQGYEYVCKVQWYEYVYGSGGRYVCVCV